MVITGFVIWYTAIVTLLILIAIFTDEKFHTMVFSSKIHVAVVILWPLTAALLSLGIMPALYLYFVIIGIDIFGLVGIIIKRDKKLMIYSLILVTLHVVALNGILQ